MVKQLTSTDSSVQETASRSLLSTVVILVCDDFMIFWYTGCPVFTVLLFSILDVPVFLSCDAYYMLYYYKPEFRDLLSMHELHCWASFHLLSQ